MEARIKNGAICGQDHSQTRWPISGADVNTIFECTVFNDARMTCVAFGFGLLEGPGHAGRYGNGSLFVRNEDLVSTKEAKSTELGWIEYLKDSDPKIYAQAVAAFMEITERRDLYEGNWKKAEEASGRHAAGLIQAKKDLVAFTKVERHRRALMVALDDLINGMDDLGALDNARAECSRVRREIVAETAEAITNKEDDSSRQHPHDTVYYGA